MAKVAMNTTQKTRVVIRISKDSPEPDGKNDRASPPAIAATTPPRIMACCSCGSFIELFRLLSFILSFPDLPACAVSLPASLRRVVHRPENVEKLVIEDNSGIKHDAHRFSMAGRAAFNLLIAGIRKRAPGISCNRLKNAIYLPECSLNIPEASCGKGRFFKSAGLLHVPKC